MNDFAASLHAEFAALLARPKGGGLHEVFVRPGDLAAGLGFALAAARLCAGERTILWGWTEFSGREGGAPHGAGVRDYGLDPDRIVLARARDDAQLLQVALEGARCAGLGAAIVEVWGGPRALDLTATRRLALGCEASGASTVMLRVGAQAAPSAAYARWRVSAAPSRTQAARAPGAPSFLVRLERHRGGQPERFWHVEWDRDARLLRSAELGGRSFGAFIGAGRAGAALSQPAISFSVGGESGAADGRRRRAG